MPRRALPLLSALLLFPAGVSATAPQVNTAGSLSGSGFGSTDFGGFQQGATGDISCASGSCSFSCLNGTCATSPAPTAGAAPGFPGSLKLDEAVAVTPAADGFSMTFSVLADNDAIPNGSRANAAANTNGVLIDVYAPLPAGRQIVSDISYSFQVNWRNGDHGATASGGLSDRCVGQGSAAAPSLGTRPTASGGDSTAGTISCVLTPDVTKTIQTADGTYVLVQRVFMSMGAFLHINFSMGAGFSGTARFTFKPKGKELQAVGGSTQAVAGTAFGQPFVVKVLQSDTGATVSGEPITFTVKDANGVAGLAVSTATAPDGTASADFAIPAPGNYTVEAACGGCVAGSPVDFPAVVTAPPATLSLVMDSGVNGHTGDGQRGFVGDFLTLPLRVKLQSGGADKLLAGVTVQFVVQSPPGALGAWVLPGSAVTDAGGEASTVLTFGAQPGDYRVRAVCEDCTANREVDFVETARPIPTFVAGFFSDFWEGPTVALPLNRTINALLPGVSADVTATGIPAGLSYSWEIVQGADKVRFDGATDGPQVSLFPLGPSVNENDVEVAVTYGRDFLGRKARAIRRLTVQQPVRVDYVKEPAVPCASSFDPKTGLPLPGLAKEGAQGPNGSLIPFRAIIHDQFGGPFGVPQNKSLLAVEKGLWTQVNGNVSGGHQAGDILSGRAKIDSAGVFSDQIGFCAGVAYPTNHLEVIDRCIFASSPFGNLRIQREIAVYSGMDASITSSADSGCVSLP